MGVCLWSGSVFTCPQLLVFLSVGEFFCEMNLKHLHRVFGRQKPAFRACDQDYSLDFQQEKRPAAVFFNKLLSGSRRNVWIFRASLSSAGCGWRIPAPHMVSFNSTRANSRVSHSSRHQKDGARLFLGLAHKPSGCHKAGMSLCCFAATSDGRDNGCWGAKSFLRGRLICLLLDFHFMLWCFFFPPGQQAVFI